VWAHETQRGGISHGKELKYLIGAVSAQATHDEPLSVAPRMTKIPIIESLLDKCDVILIGGGMIFTFTRPWDTALVRRWWRRHGGLARTLMAKAEERGVKRFCRRMWCDKFDNDSTRPLPR
jgi:phosphoglycerate kinase